MLRFMNGKINRVQGQNECSSDYDAPPAVGHSALRDAEGYDRELHRHDNRIGCVRDFVDPGHAITLSSSGNESKRWKTMGEERADNIMLLNSRSWPTSRSWVRSRGSNGRSRGLSRTSSSTTDMATCSVLNSRRVITNRKSSILIRRRHPRRHGHSESSKWQSI